MSKYSTTIKKERVYASNGVLNVVPLKSDGKENYSVSATDVRWVKLDKSRVKFQLVWEKDAKVSELVKKYNADLGFNFPFFHTLGIPIADCKIGSTILNQGYDAPNGAKQTVWNGLRYSNGQLDIGSFDINENISSDGFLVKTTPLLVNDGNLVWDYYRKVDGTAYDISGLRAQRTIVGLDSNGDIILAFGDGRTKWDRGMSLEESALFMKSKGAVVALNGDGGGSTVIATKDGVLNQNSGANERVVHHAVLVYFLDEPENNLPSSSISEEIVLSGGYTIEEAYLTPDKWVRPQTLINPTKGVLHWTGNINQYATDRANRNYFEGLTNGYASSQTVGDGDSILVCIPFMPNVAEMAYHVGASSYKGQFNYAGSYPNSYTLGHEMCVNKGGNFRESYKRSVWIMAYWCAIYNWDVFKDVVRHYDVTGKGCPLPMLDLILDTKYCKSVGWSDEDIKWMQTNLQIDGVQGEKLWSKYLNDVFEVKSAMDNNGKIFSKGVEPMKLSNEQWHMLTNSLTGFYDKTTSGEFGQGNDILSNYDWITKSYNHELTTDEVAWLTLIMFARMNKINTDKDVF